MSNKECRMKMRFYNSIIGPNCHRVRVLRTNFRDKRGRFKFVRGGSPGRMIGIML